MNDLIPDHCRVVDELFVVFYQLPHPVFNDLDVFKELYGQRRKAKTVNDVKSIKKFS